MSDLASDEPLPALHSLPGFQSVWTSGELWLTASSEVESGDRGVNAILQQV